MAFVIDTQGSHRFNKNDNHRINDDDEENDDDFLFIPLKLDQRRPSFVEDNEYLEVDESYPSFRNISTVKKSPLKSVSDQKGTCDRSKSQHVKPDPSLAKSIMLQPGLEKLERVPSYLESKRMKQLKRKAEQAKTKGFKWFNLPAPEVTEELKNDIEALQMRSALDPKHFYKKNDMKHTPKYFQIIEDMEMVELLYVFRINKAPQSFTAATQAAERELAYRRSQPLPVYNFLCMAGVGKIVDSPADFYSSRIPKKERKRTLVDDLLADAEFQRQTKRRYREIISERQKTTLQYVRQKRRQQKKKGVKKNKSNDRN